MSGLRGAEGAANHAWAEVYLPGAGLKCSDPTNAAVVDPDRIPVVVHRRPEAVAPVAGKRQFQSGTMAAHAGFSPSLRLISKKLQPPATASI